MTEEQEAQIVKEKNKPKKMMMPPLAPALVRKNKIVGSQLKVGLFEVELDIRGILLGRLNDVDDTESLLSPICWAPLYWAPLYWAV